MAAWSDSLLGGSRGQLWLFDEDFMHELADILHIRCIINERRMDPEFRPKRPRNAMVGLLLLYDVKDV